MNNIHHVILRRSVKKVPYFDYDLVPVIRRMNHTTKGKVSYTGLPLTLIR